MKLSEIRPCDNCGKKIAPLFYVVRVSLAVFTNDTETVIGLTQILGSLPLAEVMAPEAEVVKIFGDENKELMTELLICSDCETMKRLNLAELTEKKRDYETSRPA